MDGTTETIHSSTSGDTVDIREEARADARAVADTAKQQTRSALTGINRELQQQMSQQKTRLASGLREISDELDSAADGSTGAVSEFAWEAASRTRRISMWVDTHEPSDVVRSVEQYARRRPMAFLFGAMAAGVIVGRVTRNAAASRKQDKQESSTGTGMDRGFYSGGVRTDPEYLGETEVIIEEDIGERASLWESNPEADPRHQPLPGEGNPLSQRGYDPQSAYPNNDQPVGEVVEPMPGTNPRQGTGKSSRRRK